MSIQYNETFWYFDPELEPFSHPHWKNFPPTSPLYHYLVGIFIAVIGIFGLLGNMLVIYVFLSTKSLRTPTNMLIINLAVSDMSFAAINGFPLKTIASFNMRWGWGKLACELYGFAGGVLGFNSIFSLAFISVDRFFVIAQPFQTLKTLTYARAIGMIIASWLWSLMLSVPPFFGFGN
ncbi:unnamed protein product [Protopolystoma xenopodis]|uniref:G-protein coupled receptors family 1 profile domain-containing protein n=1 Tax=Protopolystoma xenopodis TaxID=117903 RepID=A0A448WAJ2_9PLAT|nr:unnamed protein product [Protopolystoma xenopodis]